MARPLPRFSRALAAHLESKRQPLYDMVQRVEPILGEHDDPNTGEESAASFMMQSGLAKAAEEAFRYDYPITHGIRTSSNADIWNPVTPRHASEMIRSYREDRDNPNLKAKYGEYSVDAEAHDLRQAFANRHKYR